MSDTLVILHGRMVALFRLLAQEGESVVIDGMPGFNEKAQFTNGKVIHLAAHVVANLLPPEDLPDGITSCREIIRFSARIKMETWGMLNALSGLWLLKQRELLDACVDPETLSLLREKLRWQDFVDPEHDYALIHKPTNYYGVAFGIARYRELLGWDEPGASAILLNHLMDHITRYSGALGFMDETPGYGRFDRYSILIPAEITALVLATGWQEPDLIRRMLRRSADIVLQMASPRGTGFSYGRSIGAYGDTAALSILSTAAALGGIFRPEEERIAFGYCRRLMETMVSFWYDEEMRSINMWEKGRRTDGYRNKHRILGENISLSMQMEEAIAQWSGLGYDWSREPEGWEDDLRALPASSLTVFSEEPFPRSLLLHRDGDRVWALPLIGGGPDYFDRDPYLPVPRCNGLLEAVPDVSLGCWVPCLAKKDGGLLIPSGRAEKETLEKTEEGCIFRFHQSSSLLAGDSPLSPVPGMEVDTTCTFTPGSIRREDVIRLSADLAAQVSSLRLSCAILAGKISVSGYRTERSMTYANAVDAGICLDTPHGSCRELRQYELPNPPSGEPIRVSWCLSY